MSDAVETAAWQNDPELVRRFLADRPRYEELGNEIAYILRKRLEEAGVAFSGVPSRAKTLGSFLQKLERKRYERPFEEVFDFVGVRVLCLYRSGFEHVRRIVREEFTIIEELNKYDDMGVDRFGYGAWHFVVRLGTRSVGARYDHLKDLACEIQVRSVVQDAWAVVQHHLVYKKEAEVPAAIQRSLNALAAQFELADDHFDKLRTEREEYREQVRSNPVPASVELDLDSLSEYLGKWFPERQKEGYEGQMRLVFEKLTAAGFKLIGPLDESIHSTEDTRTRFFAEFGLSDIRTTADGRVPGALDLLFAVALATDVDLATLRFNPRWRAALEKYRRERKTGSHTAAADDRRGRLPGRSKGR